MNRRHFILLSIGAGGLTALGGHTVSAGVHRVERKAWAFGSEVSLIAYHEHRATAEAALTAAFKVLDDIENVLSLYRPESDICRLNRGGALAQPHPDLVKVLRSALDWARLTGGAFDPTVQPLWPLYASGKSPEPSAIETVRRLINWRQVRLDDHGIHLSPVQAITLNGIAQGYAADRVSEVLRAHGIQQALVNTGEYGALGRKPEGAAWRIGIQHPRVKEAYVALADLDNRFLATSGDYETTFSDDFSSHHIFDPATGRSPTTLASVTVVASSGLEADALSTAIFVLGPDRGLELAASRPGVEALLMLKNGEVLTTPHFPKVA